MANEKALTAHMARTQHAEEMCAKIQAYIDSHGNVAPDEVDWSHVGTMAEVSHRLRSLVNFIEDEEE